MTEKKNVAETELKDIKETKTSRFTKEQIISSARYADKKDLISALLDENIMYTLETVDKLINGFMKGKVK